MQVITLSYFDRTGAHVATAITRGLFEQEGDRVSPDIHISVITQDDDITLRVEGFLTDWFDFTFGGETDLRKLFGPHAMFLDVRTIAYMIRDCYLNS